VQLAATWEPRGLPADEVRVSVAAAPRTAADPLNARFDLTVAGPAGGFDLDWVEVTLTLTDARLRDLAIDLRSPAGTVMTVVPNLAAAGNRTWLDATFAVAGLRGEDIAGTWTLSLRHPEATPRLSVYAARLDFYGDPDRADDVHVFTPAYASLARGDAARRVIVNDDGGVDALNFAAATPGITANLATGRGQADGTGFRLSGVFGTVIGSSGGDRIVGGAGDDRLSGGAGEDVIIGGAGNDRIDGGPGADRMTGGPGDDVYRVDHPGDVIVELVGQGRDRVEGAIDIDLARLGRQIEDATLTGTGDLRLTGNALANRLIGNAGANTIRGAGGDDWIDGGGGGDLMIGGAGADTFVFTPPEGPVSAVARIHDFTSGTDRILLRGLDSAAAVLAADTSPPPDGPAAVISLDAARGLVFLDPDGAGPAGALTLFTLRPGTAITADDFLFG
jgi:Ca2+-binding RTX toxin-like protein